MRRLWRYIAFRFAFRRRFGFSLPKEAYIWRLMKDYQDIPLEVGLVCKPDKLTVEQMRYTQRLQKEAEEIAAGNYPGG